MIKKQILMFKINPSFQKEIFQRLINRYGGSIKASPIIKIPASSIRGYKNSYFDSVPKDLIDKLINLKIIKYNELNKNLLSTFNKNDQIREVLDKGRQIRNKQLQKWKKEIPSLKEILNNEQLNFEKWFVSYQKLIDFGMRKFNYVKKEKNYIEVSYVTHSNKEKKEFILKFPRKIKLDEEFIYFFGLWCGDRAGGKRFGVTNKNNEIINFTEFFLDKNYQEVEKILYIAKGHPNPKIKFDKKIVINKDRNGWVLSVHSINGIFASFFYYLQSYLQEFLFAINNKHAFFAGLFDAEGNVSLYNKSFRWACKNDRLIKIYTEFLKQLSLYDRYDGACFVTYNRKRFYDKILPYLKHSEKINLTTLLCKGKGILPKTHLTILKHLQKYPKETARGVAKALKKSKVYSELMLLSNFGYVSREGYPSRHAITSKGLKLLGG